MSHTLTIARRELRERSFVFITAIVLGIVPFVAALLPIAEKYGRTGMMVVVATIIVPCMTLGIAAALGASIIGRELSERRMSFYFARPVSPAAIWFGKVIAALVLIGFTFSITFLPALSVAYGEWDKTFSIPLMKSALGVLSVAVLLFFISHFASVIVRSRSMMAFVDLVLVIAAVFAGYLIVRPLFMSFAFELGGWTVGYLLVAFGITILAAGAWQLSRGRTDARSNHRELSRFMWPVYGGFVLIAAAFVWWVFSATPSDLTKASAAQAPGGEWMVVSGETAMRGDYRPAFIMNSRTGEWIDFPEARFNLAIFSRDAKAAFAISILRGSGPSMGELVIKRLTGDRATIATGITMSPHTAATLSDDLERVAVATSETVSVTDVRTKALLASARVPFSQNVPLMFFVNRDTLRVFTQERLNRENAGPVKLKVFELNIPQKKLIQTGELATIAKWVRLQVSPDGSTIVMRRYGKDDGVRLFIVDGRTLEIRKPIDATDPRSHALLSDGRIAVFDVVDNKAVLRLYDRDGNPQREIPLGIELRGRIIDLGRPDKIVVALWDEQKSVEDRWSLALVDINRGVIERREASAYPEMAYDYLDPRIPEPNRSAKFVIMDKDSRVWRWNALTGEKTKLLGR